MIIEVESEKAKEIIETRKPKGSFWTKDNNFYVAIDNEDGEAYVEIFRTKERCINYLEGGLIEMENTENNNNDMVHHPNHYNYKSMECKDIIDIMCEGINKGQAYKLGCAIKYLYRYPMKGKPVQDLEKAKTYIDMIIKDLEDKD